MKIKTRLISLVTALALVFSLMGPMVPAAQAADYSCDSYEDCTDGGEIYVVVKDGAPIRKEAHNKGQVIARADAGTLVSVKRLFWTVKMTRWAELNVSGRDAPAYIHIDNIKAHTSHSYARILTTGSGYIELCKVCAVARAVADRETATCDLLCAAENFALGSFSKTDPTFTSIAAQIISGEIMGGVADVRDLVADILNGENAFILTMDCIAVIPILGMAKYADEIVLLAKNGGRAADTAKRTDIITDFSRFDTGAKTSSKALGDHMNLQFQKTFENRFNKNFLHPDGKRVIAAHHIVPGGVLDNKDAINARGLLSYLDIDINSYENGVWLCMTEDQCLNGAVHAGSHSSGYYRTVNQRLMDAFSSVRIASGESVGAVKSRQRDAVVQELEKIAEDLMNNDLGL